MKANTNIKLHAVILAVITFALCACNPNAPAEEDLFISEEQVSQIIKDGTLYTLDGLVDRFTTEEGNYRNDTTLYSQNANNPKNPGIYVYAIDTLPTDGPGIYIRGRVATDDWGGNFYKSLIIQQVVDGNQQALRISIDAGSISGYYPRGQEILIRCNGLALGRFANQVQLSVPSYNNNVYAYNYKKKVGWTPGRIPLARFKKATHRIGTPDEQKLQYDTCTIADITRLTDIQAARKEDGKLVVIKDVHYTGEYADDKGKLFNCSFGDPTKNNDVNVFAPTTLNFGYPQSRIVKDAANKQISVSMSEYAKQAHYYIPGAGSAYDGDAFPYDSVHDQMPATHYLRAYFAYQNYYVCVPESKTAWSVDDVIFTNLDRTDGYIYDGTNWVQSIGILHCKEYVGSVRGIRSFYMDDASDAASGNMWSISICDLRDLSFKKADGTVWVPREYNSAIR